MGTRITAASGAARALWDGLLDLVYPACCTGCAAPLAPGGTARALPLCPRCLLQLERAEPAEVAARLARLPEAAVLDGAVALWHFDKGGVLQRLQHALKYGNRPALGVALGDLVAEAWRASAPAAVPDAVLPIPLHRVRRYERGYNQSTMLAGGLGRSLGLPVREDLLVRTRTTRSQTRLSRTARWANVEGAFAVAAPGAARARHLLLVDDVLTTGATAAAAAAVLKADGAASVHLAALALARV